MTPLESAWLKGKELVAEIKDLDKTIASAKSLGLTQVWLLAANRQQKLIKQARIQGELIASLTPPMEYSYQDLSKIVIDGKVTYV